MTHILGIAFSALALLILIALANDYGMHDWPEVFWDTLFGGIVFYAAMVHAVIGARAYG